MYESIVEIHIKRNLNAASGHLDLGNSASGLLVLTVTPVVYNTLAGVSFVPPVNSGQTFFITQGSTGPYVAALD